METYRNSKEKRNIIKSPADPLETVFEECMKEVFELVYQKASVDAPIRHIQTIIKDMEDIRKTSLTSYETIHLLITGYPTTYQEIADKRKVSRSSVYQTLQRLSQYYDWVDQLMKVQAKQNQSPPSLRVNKRKGTSRTSF